LELQHAHTRADVPYARVRYSRVQPVCTAFISNPGLSPSLWVAVVNGQGRVSAVLSGLVGSVKVVTRASDAVKRHRARASAGQNRARVGCKTASDEGVVGGPSRPFLRRLAALLIDRCSTVSKPSKQAFPLWTMKQYLFKSKDHMYVVFRMDC
jgi:hypothetical protein